MKPHRLVVVKWRDAHGTREENNYDLTLKAHKPAIYYTAGVLVHSDDVGVTVSQDLGVPLGDDEEVSYRQRSFIPRGMVDEERIVGPVVKKPKVVKA